MTSIVLTSCGNLPIIKQVAWLLGQVMNALFNVLDLIGIPNIGLAIFLFTIIVLFTDDAPYHQTAEVLQIICQNEPGITGYPQ